jgi:hypothetical protein
LISLLSDLPPTTLRRIGRFIQIALIGARRCVGNAGPPPETAIFFTTGRGDFEMTVEMMDHLLRNGEAPKPLSLINSVSNAACFYVAKHFGLHGANVCVGASHFSFEAALQLSVVDLRARRTAQALVGSADIVIPPLAVHRRRLERREYEPLGEASHWLWLSLDPAEREGPILAAVELFFDAEELQTWLSTLDLDSNTVFAAGQHLASHEADRLRTMTGLTKTLNYRAKRPYYDCQAGAVISSFLSGQEGEAMLYVNCDPGGRFAAMLVRR